MAQAANDSPTGIPVNDRVNYAAADDASGGVSTDRQGNVSTRMYYGENEKGDIISVGYGANQVDPALAKAAGYTRREDNPFNYTIGEHFSAMGKDVGNIATQVATDIGKISPVANILGLLSKDEPEPKPKPKRDDSNDSPISMPTPRPKSPSGVKSAQKKGKGYVGGFGF